MRKLKLALDTLSVESFETARVEGIEGTVQGHAVKSGQPIYTCDNLCQPTYLCPSHHQTECCGAF